jgi:AraC-like DNA-binding protein
VSGTILRSVPVAIAEVAIGAGVDRDAATALLGPADDERIPIEKVYALWELAVRTTGDNALPVRVGAMSRFDRYGALGIAIYVSRNNEIGLRRLCRYHDMITDSGTWSIRVDGDDLIVAFDRQGERRLGMRLANEHVLASWVTVARQVTATQLREIRLRHTPPEGIEAYASLFGVPVRGGATEDAIVLPASFLQGKPIASDAFVERFIVEQIEKAAGTKDHESFSTMVGRMIVEALPDGVPTIGAISAQLATSERTLRRRLTEAGTSFDQLLENLQRERAEALLKGTYPIREIALAVGFSDPSAFSRAFKRWTGKTPSEARARQD